VGALVRRAQEQYTQARDALRREDWVTYGKALNDLQDTLNDLAKLTGR
jgi:uncharacterized membrane protein (UPF0182 family)